MSAARAFPSVIMQTSSSGAHGKNGSAPLPNSKKIYVSGKLHPEIKVPFREISLAPTKTMSGQVEVNEPIRVYDTSGPWGSNDDDLDVTRGLPPLRREWILKRGDVEEIDGRKVQPIDDGFLSETHAAHSNGNTSPARSSTSQRLNASTSRKTLRANNGNAVTQLFYARKGIVTPEMEFIAIRENLGRETVAAVYDRRNGENRRSQSAAT